MNKSIIKLVTMLLAAVMMLSFISCSVEEDEKEEIVGLSTPVPIPDELIGSIVFSSYRCDDGEYACFDFMQTFVMQYPSVDVELDLADSAEEYFSTLEERIENGTIGDVFTIDSSMLGKYAEKNYIVDLSNHSQGVIDFTSANYDKLYPSKIFYPAALANSLYDGRMFMCPVEYNNTVMFLNLDMLSSIGLDPVVPKDDWTWQEVEQIALKLVEAGYDKPIAMDYSDYSVWGAFARSKNAALYDNVDFADKNLALKLTNPDVLSGIEYLANNFIKAGLVADKTPAEIKAEELSDYGMIICNHSDLVRWEKGLNNRGAAQNSLDWELAHFPRFYDEKTETSVASIGVQTIGLAVFNRDQFNLDNGVYEAIDDDELLAEEKENVENTIVNSIRFALYAMVEEAAVAITGADGYRVPALISANAKKYWRNYPVDGKNTSVFSLYSDFDYPAEVTSFLLLAPSAEINNAMGDAIKKYAESNDISFDVYMQIIQDAVNSH